MHNQADVCSLQESIAHLLTRPVGRPPNRVQRYYASFSYQAGSWDRKRRAVAKVEWHPGELVPREAALSSPTCRAPPSGWWPSTISEAKRSSTSRKARTRSNGRGCRAASSATTRFGSSFTPWLTISPTSCGRWPCRRKWSIGPLTTLREKLVKIGAKVVRHGRYVTFQLAEVAVPRSLFQKILGLIDDLRRRPVPA